jgi:hypothetical protein
MTGPIDGSKDSQYGFGVPTAGVVMATTADPFECRVDPLRRRPRSHRIADKSTATVRSVDGRP